MGFTWLIFMLSVGNREKQAPWGRYPDGFLWQTDEPYLKACSLHWLQRLTTQDPQQCTLWLKIIKNYFIKVSLTLFFKYIPHLGLLYIQNFENKLFISAGLNTTVTHQPVLHFASFILHDIGKKDFYYNIYKYIYTHLSSLHTNMWMWIF